MKHYLLFVTILALLVLVVSAPASTKYHHLHKDASRVGLPSHTLTPSQTTSVKAALKALRKLDVATQAGVSQSDYQSRLIDTKVDVTEDLRGLPKTLPVVVHINSCLAAYQDASDVWNDKEDYRDWSMTKDLPLVSPKVVKKYNISVDYQNPDLQVADRDDLADYFHSVITKGRWKAASNEYSKAEANLK